MTEQIKAILVSYRYEHAILHREWSAAIDKPGYVKRLWIARNNELIGHFRSALTDLGYTGPLLGGDL